jgi:hypothetical protein
MFVVQVVVQDMKEVDLIRQREMDITKERIQKILDAGANVVLTTKGIDDLCMKVRARVWWVWWTCGLWSHLRLWVRGRQGLWSLTCPMCVWVWVWVCVGGCVGVLA